ncbi:hypothetical protein BDBG_16384 [Blastomyces gilchristii SLH14081]|uniref:Uncharacterized protein n=1 Tax=Blastomyces gilchristii (strain SLH14081) TaxID=559298 RepID=A0A179UCJ5_BLAGS|nr:uncharacterized protein BDBG_16384 [Blastomyces gilchristii SLH14081]OAT05008.1 hypothetical protein BDBG_16384 [Blastomyces gilchristii SLH14081]
MSRFSTSLINIRLFGKALNIILAAQRPLTLSEMNVDVNIDHKSESIHDLDLEEEGLEGSPQILVWIVRFNLSGQGLLPSPNCSGVVPRRSAIIYDYSQGPTLASLYHYP